MVVDVDDLLLDMDASVLAHDDFLSAFDFRDLTLGSARDARDDPERSVDDRPRERDDRANDADVPEGDVVDKLLELDEKGLAVED